MAGGDEPVPGRGRQRPYVRAWAVPSLADSARIPIVMPDDDCLPRTQEERDRFVEDLARRLKTAIRSQPAAKGNRFEIQLVEHINAFGYGEVAGMNLAALPMSAGLPEWLATSLLLPRDWGPRQQLCLRFASDVYRALDKVKQDLAAEGSTVSMKAIVGSNGGFLFSRGLQYVEHVPFDAAVLVDARAYAADTVWLYSALKQHLAVVNTRFDCWALSDMVANRGTAQATQRVCPGLGVFNAETNQDSGHLATMHPGRTLKVAERWEDGRYLPVKVSNAWELLQTALNRPSASPAKRDNLGGIDFTHFALSCVEATPGGGDVEHLFSALHLGGRVDAEGLAQASRLSLDAFWVGLSVPDDAFWVNLNPTEPDRIADPRLATTDIARVLLVADLELKKDSARITDPRSSELGRLYWRALEDAIGGERIQQQTRVWIVPGRVELMQASDTACLKSASLDVCLESEYLASRSGRNDAAERSKGEAISKQFVLPQLTELVNCGSAYAQLRQVYAGLVLARWYKEHFRYTPGARLENGDVSGHESSHAWDRREIWNRYVGSVKNGEYHFTEEKREQRGQTTIIHTTSYFSGGVDFTHILAEQPEAMDVKTQEFVNKALQTPGGVRAGQWLWFASLGSASAPERGERQPTVLPAAIGTAGEKHKAPVMLLLGGCAVAVLVGCVLLMYRRTSL